MFDNYKTYIAEYRDGRELKGFEVSAETREKARELAVLIVGRKLLYVTERQG